MKELNYKLIVSDYDGTLLPKSGVISDKVKNAINEYVESGGVFAVCTGRMTASILPRVRELGLKGLVVAYQGTVIADIESGKYLRHGFLSCGEGQEICSVIEKTGKVINAYADEVLYTTAGLDNRLVKKYEEITGIKANHINCRMSEYIKDNNLQCQKIISVVSPDEKLPLYNYMRETLGEKFEITYSSDILVEVSPLGDNKGKALNFLADYYKIPINKTIAIGDNLNDLPMLKAAGMGVAVKNATEDLKSNCDCICPSCDDGGVGEIILKYGFKEYYA